MNYIFLAHIRNKTNKNKKCFLIIDKYRKCFGGCLKSFNNIHFKTDKNLHFKLKMVTEKQVMGEMEKVKKKENAGADGISQECKSLPI